MARFKVCVIFFLFFTGCRDTGNHSARDTPVQTGTAITETAVLKERSDSKVVEVITRHMEFYSADSISSGWTTFKYVNLSSETHFLILKKMPEGIHLEDFSSDIIPVYKEGMDRIIDGDIEFGQKAFEKLPAWNSRVGVIGGVGLVSPGEAGRSIINLSPGNYLMECYVKRPDGNFHSFMGMLKEIVVTEANGEQGRPNAAYEIDLSSENGIALNDIPAKGLQTFAVNFLDQEGYKNLQGHDVHLVRLGKNADLDKLSSWMNWMDPKGLMSPAPSDLVFLGGIQELDEGQTGFFQVNLTPGNYALISEIPDPLSAKMLYLFTVD
ncbi:hypothetical protein [Robertkochia solimangrovi]|uniref:hypothetical protein n=1 Tax=Robertkochia solimangrovi TaxID=2213046 RepID=UPI001180723C|nr:hypothetical protein [Robertkochia solimangrovi]TRZ45933.1 hypothetical protein DMZ48_01270 [Robertkochia solimangrovi]